MTWHLKDRELEKKLEEFSGGNFVNSLNQEIESDGIDSEFVVRVGFGRKLLGDDDKDNCLLFRTDELEEVVEYDPHVWNEFPKVKPPYNVMMRVETHTGQGYKLFYNHLGDGDFWCDPNFLLMPKAFSDDVTRFRPWSDD